MINVFGIRFRIHPLLVIVMLLSVFAGHFVEIITLFGLVFIHELGHAAAAKHYGWRVTEVQLTPFGGVAVTEEAGSVPALEEAVVAICGPLMNAVMIGFALLMGYAGLWSEAWKTYWIEANLLLMLFNLLPIMPLDGGKLLQAALSFVIPYHRTMRLSAAASLLISGLLVGAALSRLGENGLELNLAMIGSFLLYANWYDWRTIHYRFLRFLMKRSVRVAEWTRRGAEAKPILAMRTAVLPSIVTKFMRERLHVILILDERRRLIAALPEESCTSYYLEKKSNSAVSELFM